MYIDSVAGDPQFIDGPELDALELRAMNEMIKKLEAEGKPITLPQNWKMISLGTDHGL